MANNTNNEENTTNSKRGFGSMDENKQREIASKGGKAAHQKGTAHEFTSEEAKRAGQKGGQARQGASAVDAAAPSDLNDLSDLTEDLDR